MYLYAHLKEYIKNKNTGIGSLESILVYCILYIGLQFRRKYSAVLWVYLLLCGLHLTSYEILFPFSYSFLSFHRLYRIQGTFKETILFKGIVS
jgi:hypothetical protein